MATTNIMSAPLLPTAPLMNDFIGETNHYVPPPETFQKTPNEVSVEVPEELPQKEPKEVEQQEPLETAPDAPHEVPVELLEEVPQNEPEEVEQETPLETAQEPLQEAPQEPAQETPDITQDISSEDISQPSQPDVVADVAEVAEVEEPIQPSPANKPKPIIPVKEDLSPSDRVPFDPVKHIQFTPPSKVWTMQELDYPEGKGISSVGVSEPFPLFSKEAVQQMRAEILSEEVWDKYQYSSNLSHCQLRGYAPECAPFIYDAWRSPEVLEIVSKIAGIDLVPVMDWEIGHINVAVKSESEKRKELEIAQRNADEGVAGCPLEDDNPVVDWHTDSYPFVCVTMLSDCTDMVGGETMLRKGNGGTVKVRGPQMGSAVILQGRYIEHQALRALGAAERITSVTSFRPRSAAIKDETVLTTIRGISDLSEVYHQYSEYRFEILQDRLRDMERKMRDRKRATRPFDTKATKAFIREQIQFLEAMDREMINDDLVQKGYIGHDHLVSEETKENSRKRGVYLEETVAA